MLKHKERFVSGMIFLAILGASLFFLPPNFISADVISQNSGGSTNIILNPDTYIEGFFFGNVQVPVCGNGVIEGTEQCDDGNIVSGDGCSSICVTESTGGDTGGTTGGGTTGGAVTTALNLDISPSEFNINMLVSTNVERTISITNNGISSVIVSVSQSNLDNLIILNGTSFTLAAGESKTLDVIFVAPSEEASYSGNLIIGGNSVPITLNVKTKLLLFDSNIVVLNKDYLVSQGSDLKTQVILTPMGDKERMDVTLDYAIKDYAGKIYLTKSETLLIDNQINFKRDFSTGSLPLGKYIISLDLTYPNGVAPSSAHFEVVEPSPSDIIGRIMLYLIILILLILILILVILIIRYMKKRNEQSQSA